MGCGAVQRRPLQREPNSLLASVMWSIILSCDQIQPLVGWNTQRNCQLNSIMLTKFIINLSSIIPFIKGVLFRKKG